MRAILQRVLSSDLKIDQKIHASIGPGLMILIGIEEADDRADAEWLAQKIIGMRIFSDSEGKMNLDLNQVNGDLLIVSQFTLFAAVKKGNRPSFIRSAKLDKAKELYDFFIQECQKLISQTVKTGVFGAHMQIALVNDGPVTIFIDTKDKE